MQPRGLSGSERDFQETDPVVELCSMCSESGPGLELLLGGRRALAGAG